MDGPKHVGTQPYPEPLLGSYVSTVTNVIDIILHFSYYHTNKSLINHQIVISL